MDWKLKFTKIYFLHAGVIEATVKLTFSILIYEIMQFLL